MSPSAIDPTGSTPVPSNVIALFTRRRLDAAHGTQPVRGECLACYVYRMIRGGPCPNGLTWTAHWRDRQSAGATALLRRLSDNGALCDCAVIDGFWVPSPSWDLCPPLEVAGPVCLGVRPRSTKACDLWDLNPSGGWYSCPRSQPEFSCREVCDCLECWPVPEDLDALDAPDTPDSRRSPAASGPSRRKDLQ